MPRMARLVLPLTPHHVIQRGHNRKVVFASDADYHYYLKSLREWTDRLGCEVYAYCLMTNHVHVIVTAGPSGTELAKLMKRVAGRQTRYVNRMEGRSGTLWEGRYRSSPIQTDRYLLVCSRYVELNPVRAGLVADPGDYAWSSYRAKVGLGGPFKVDFDPCYVDLGGTAAERAERYAAWVHSAIDPKEWDEIREAVQRGYWTGTDRFGQEVAARFGRSVERRGPGRPRKLRK